jgi:hypothetical protein
MSGVINLGPEFVSGSGRLTAASRALRRGRCGEAWADFNVEAATNDSSYGRFYRLATRLAEATGTQATAGTGVYIPDTSVGGFTVLEVDCNSTTNGQGYQLQWKGHGWYPEEGGAFYMHLRARFKDIATGPEFFGGLATVDTTLIASDAMSATNWIGFLSLSSGTVVAGVDDGTEDLSGTIHTMVDGDTTTDGTDIVDFDLRWRVGEKLEVWVDGVKQDMSAVDLANEPDGGSIVPSLVLQTNGTTDPIMHVLDFDIGYKYPA